MRVNFYADLRQIAGSKEVEFDLPPGATAGELIGTIVVRYPQMRDRLLDDSDGLDRRAHAFINGRDVRYLKQNLDTPLSAEDQVDIFPCGHF